MKSAKYCVFYKNYYKQALDLLEINIFSLEINLKLQMWIL